MGLIRYFRLRSRPRLSCIKIYKKLCRCLHKNDHSAKSNQHKKTWQAQRISSTEVPTTIKTHLSFVKRGVGANPPLTSAKARAWISFQLNGGTTAWSCRHLAPISCLYSITSLDKKEPEQNKTIDNLSKSKQPPREPLNCIGS